MVLENVVWVFIAFHDKKALLLANNMYVFSN